MAKKNYFKEVSSYQKEHPRGTREAAMKAVSAMRKKSNKVSGKPFNTSKLVSSGAKRKYSVLLRYDSGVDKTVTISAANENDARWIGKKKPGVYSAAVLKRVDNKTKTKISGVAGIKKARPVKVAGTKKSRVSGASVGGKLAIGNAIIGKINSLEQQRKKEVGKLKKDLLALEINSQHAKLDKLMRDYKKA